MGQTFPGDGRQNRQKARYQTGLFRGAVLRPAPACRPLLIVNRHSPADHLRFHTVCKIFRKKLGPSKSSGLGFPYSMTETKPQRRLGCARVSTYGQTLDAQLEQLEVERCGKIYREKASGARADRRELLKLLKRVTPGDVVTVTRVDRLARSTFDLFAMSSKSQAAPRRGCRHRPDRRGHADGP